MLQNEPAEKLMTDHDFKPTEIKHGPAYCVICSKKVRGNSHTANLLNIVIVLESQSVEVSALSLDVSQEMFSILLETSALSQVCSELVCCVCVQGLISCLLQTFLTSIYTACDIVASAMQLSLGYTSMITGIIGRQKHQA